MADERPVQFERFGPMLKASLGQVRMKCGKKGCRCTQGQLHSAFYLSFRHGGRTKTLHIPKDLVERVEASCLNWRRFKGFLEKETERELVCLLKAYRKKRRSQT